VYTAVNNETGELMAMKEIQLQPNDHRTIRRVAEELRIFEGIQHNNLVRYYGVEIHRVSSHILLPEIGMCITCEIGGSYSSVDKDISLCCFINCYKHSRGSVVPNSSRSLLGHLDPEERGTML